MLTTCQNCKEEVDVAMYFYNHMITKEKYFLTQATEYKALVTGKAICPCCGMDIKKTFSSIISNKDIVKLAIWKETHK
jgi:uncharacterized protein (UPF0212 family)